MRRIQYFITLESDLDQIREVLPIVKTIFRAK